MIVYPEVKNPVHKGAESEVLMNSSSKSRVCFDIKVFVDTERFCSVTVCF